MSYFNHAYKKMFVATSRKEEGTNPDDRAQTIEISGGVIITEGLHVSHLKHPNFGPGIVGIFDPETHLSLNSQVLGKTCCPFYIAGAAIKLRDKQGPFHGGYQESNKSKIINPKYMRKAWIVPGNGPQPSILEIGCTGANGEIGAVLTGSITEPGEAYQDGTYTDVALTGGSGTGVLAEVAVEGGEVVNVVITTPGLGYEVGDILGIPALVEGGTGNSGAFTVATVDEDNECCKDFYCGESYYLRVEVKGTPALRFANHNLYRTLQADGGCCEDPSDPAVADQGQIYKQWAEQIFTDPYLRAFILPVVVADGQSYWPTEAIAADQGMSGFTFETIPANPTTAGLILQGSYYDTQFANCTFQPTDYYGIEPIQLYASEVDLNGDPCTFETLCVKERCTGFQANGVGESKVRELILSESYLQNFTHNDLRIREITQGTRVYEVLDRNELYTSVFILHSVPRFNNPTGVFDNDQYLLEVVGSQETADTLEEFLGVLQEAGCIKCFNGGTFEALSTCEFEYPDVLVQQQLP